MKLLSKLFNKPSEKKSYSPVLSSLDCATPFIYNGLHNDNKLINEGHGSNTDVYSIQTKICLKASEMPKVVEEWDGEQWIVNTDSKQNDLINTPSEGVSGFDWWYASILSLLNTGDLFYKENRGGFNLVTELNFLPANLVDISLTSEYNVHSYNYDKFYTVVPYAPEEVHHIKYLNPTIEGIRSHRGLSPLQAAYNSLKASNNRLIAQASLYENRGATNLLSSGSDIILTPDERDNLQKETDKILGGAKNFNKTIVSTSNINAQSLGMSATDLKLIEAKNLDLIDICNAYGVPSNMFNDTSASTESNVKTDLKKFYTDCIIPNNERIISYLNNNIVPEYSLYENKELRIKQDTSGVEALQEDELLRAQKAKTEVETILSISNDSSLKENQKKP